MEVLRTPEERFVGLADFPYEPHYVDIADADLGALRVHYLDERPVDGAANGETIVLLHGQATWSYSYRRMIPLLTAAGYRVIAPDLIGFGRSDKPSDWEAHSFEKHVQWLTATLDALNLREANFFMFDWGGYFGLRVMAERPEIFSRVVLCTANMPQGKGIGGAIWVALWRRRVLGPPEFPISSMVDGMTDTDLPAATLQGLDAPYPDESYKAGPRRFPMMIPGTFMHPAAKPNRAAWAKLAGWTKPVLTLVSERLAKRGFNPDVVKKQIPGTANQPHATFPDTGFFIIEDAPEEMARHTLEFIAQNSATADAAA